MIIVWNSNFETGDLLIDSQHKELFKRINNLYSINISTKSVEELLLFLQDYVIFHFKSEEEKMLDANYKGYKAHKKLHEDFIDKINSKITEFNESNGSIGEVENIRSLSSNWLVDHVLKVDIHMIKMLNKKVNNDSSSK